MIAVEVAPRRWPIAVAAAAAALLIAGIVLAPGTDRTTARPRRRSIRSLGRRSHPHRRRRRATTTLAPATVDDLVPPPGAVLSSPETGELVAAVSKIHDGAWYLYADGRLISIDDSPGSVDPAGSSSASHLRRRTGPLRVPRQRAVRPEPAAERAAARGRRGSSLRPVYVTVDDCWSRGTGPSSQKMCSHVGEMTSRPRCYLVRYLRDLTSSFPERVGGPGIHALRASEVHGVLHAARTQRRRRARRPAGGVGANALVGIRAAERSTADSRRSSCFDLTIADTRVLAASLIDAFGIPCTCREGPRTGSERAHRYNWTPRSSTSESKSGRSCQPVGWPCGVAERAL